MSRDLRKSFRDTLKFGSKELVLEADGQGRSVILGESMLTNKEIVGQWSVDILYGPGAQEDTIIVFLPNGTGWIEFSHYYLCELETFYWELNSDGTISIQGDTYYNLKNTFRSSDLNLSNINVSIDSKKTILGEEIPVIIFERPIWLSEKTFGLVTRDVSSVKLPEFEE